MSIGSYIKRGISYIIRGVPNYYTKTEVLISPKRDNLKDRKIVVSGGGQGIGLAIAERLINDGAQVLIAGRNEEKLKKASKHIGSKYAVLDITHSEALPSFINTCSEILGGLTDLVNNAGVSLHEKTFFDVTPESFDIQISTNLKGTFFLTQSFIRHLKENKIGGNVVMISSETGDTVDYRPYGYTKAAINSMVKGLANLFKKDGIRINAVSPGITSTEMTKVSSDGNYYAGDYGIGRYYLPEEVAEVVSFLLSPNAQCISGQIITCNNAQTVNPRWK